MVWHGFPGHTHAAVHVQVFLGAEVVGANGGYARGGGQLLPRGQPLLPRVQSVAGTTAGDFQQAVDFRQLVLDALEAANQLAEGAPLAGIVASHV
ncbi:hypothetical protein D9M71_805490 [compost metagenome]